MNATFLRVFGPRDDRGAVAVTVALLLMVFILLAALVVDVGYWYNVRRQLQSAADAAALAGCWQLIKTGSDAESDAADRVGVLDVARQYALKNAVTPAVGLHMIDDLSAANPSTGHLYTQVTNKYVQVTVETTAPAFFAAVLGYSGNTIMAQSRAEAQWLQGMRNTVPFSLPIINLPTRVTVQVGNGARVDLSKGADGKWRASGVPVPSAASNSAYPLHFVAYNRYNVATPLVVKSSGNDAVGAIVRASGVPYTDLWLTRYVVGAINDDPTDQGTDLHIASTDPPKQISFDGRNYPTQAYPLLGGPGEWIQHLPSPATDYLSDEFPVTVQWGQGNNATNLSPAAWVVARRSSFPIKSVSASPHVVASGGTISVELELNQMQYEKEYSLKVVASGAEVGNFCAVDLSQIYHTAYGDTPMPDPEYDPASQDPNYKSPTYKYYLANPFPFEIHVWDFIWTEPGAEVQPTSQGLLDRFAGDANLSYAQWNAAGRPLTKRLIYVPLVEQFETVSGRSLLRVVAITSFYVEPATDYRDFVKGVFIEYVAGGQGSTTPPPTGFGILTPRLVSSGLDF